MSEDAEKKDIPPWAKSWIEQFMKFVSKQNGDAEVKVSCRGKVEVEITIRKKQPEDADA